MTTLTLGGSTESLSKSLEDYNVAWKAFIVVHHLDVLEHLALPTTLSWKVADKSALYANLETIGDQAEQVHIGTVNGRFIASAVLYEDFEGMRIIKILERRQGSDDRLGLDSIDYLVKDTEQVLQLLHDAGGHVEKEHNDMHDWLSLRFGKNMEFEAKFVDHSVLEVAVKEMELAKLRIAETYRLP